MADHLVASGQEIGLQIAAYLNGELVVNVCAGKADASTGRLVDERTLFPGSGLISTVVHVLAERGLFDYADPVAAYWPEFCAHGKQGITIAHVLTHSAGVPQAPPGLTVEDLAGWDGVCARIADLRPLWRPGTATGFHVLTFGFILGEVVRRVTGRPVSAVLRDDVAAPLGVPGDLCFGAPAADLPRAARLKDGDRSDPLVNFPPGSLYHEVLPSWMGAGAALGNRPDYQGVHVPSSGGATAPALARMFAALIGEVDGVRLIGPARTNRVSSLVTVREDRGERAARPERPRLHRRHRGNGHRERLRLARQRRPRVRRPGTRVRLRLPAQPADLRTRGRRLPGRRRDPGGTRPGGQDDSGSPAMGERARVPPPPHPRPQAKSSRRTPPVGRPKGVDIVARGVPASGTMISERGVAALVR
ncbi:beta-lactamase family protein [Actinomadura sp. BRA 177]|nr:beta-lactamase family protein [Actinomadura sp. BRA 177]